MSELSGKFVLRIPQQLHRELKTSADQHGVSLNTWILNQLENSSDTSDSDLLNLLPLLAKHFLDEMMGVVLFGSYVRGESRATSDIDVLIVLKSSSLIDRSLYRVWESKIADKVSRKLEPQFVSLPTGSAMASSLWLEVALEGHILYDKEDAVRKYLKHLREQIASGDYQRKTSHGHPYWIQVKSHYAK